MSANDVSACAHDWLLESPNGPISHGRCCKCALERDFRNSFPEEERKNNSDIFAGNAGRKRRGDHELPRYSDRETELAVYALAGRRSFVG